MPLKWIVKVSSGSITLYVKEPFHNAIGNKVSLTANRALAFGFGHKKSAFKEAKLWSNAELEIL